MKILAVCGSGLGTSFMLEMNIKKILKKLEKEEGIQVGHSDLASVTINDADLFVMGRDIAESSNIPMDKIVVLESIINLKELEEKLSHVL